MLVGLALLGLARPAFADALDCGGRLIHQQDIYNTTERRDPDRFKLGTLKVKYNQDANGGKGGWCSLVIFSDRYRGTERDGYILVQGCPGRIYERYSNKYCSEDPVHGDPDNQSGRFPQDKTQLGPTRLARATHCAYVGGWLGSGPSSGVHFESDWVCR